MFSGKIFNLGVFSISYNTFINDSTKPVIKKKEVQGGIQGFLCEKKQKHFVCLACVIYTDPNVPCVKFIENLTSGSFKAPS